MMAETPGQGAGAAGIEAGGGASGEVLKDLREANEKLVLATVQAHEHAELAEAMTAALRVIEEEQRGTAKMRERLLAIVGHDLRNPLGAIALSAELLVRHGKLDQEDAYLVERIVRSGKRMDRMIKQIFDFTRARLGGGFMLRLGPADLREIWFQAADELEHLSGVRIRGEFTSDLSGRWDADRLTEVFSNILGNAIGHASPGTAISGRARVEGEVVVVEVSNQGEPIPPELLPRLFDAFEQGRSAHRGKSNEHLGLGLYIAHEIVRSHGGTIAARSAEGTTTFTIRLPREQGKGRA